MLIIIYCKIKIYKLNSIYNILYKYEVVENLCILGVQRLSRLQGLHNFRLGWSRDSLENLYEAYLD